jgi:hypothetical protein
MDFLNMFGSAEPAPTTRDGHEYIVDLFYRPFSKLVVAQYRVNLGNDADGRRKKECRERSFLFDGKALKAITKTVLSCRSF